VTSVRSFPSADGLVEEHAQGARLKSRAMPRKLAVGTEKHTDSKKKRLEKSGQARIGERQLYLEEPTWTF
jgi:hypothetical protein